MRAIGAFNRHNCQAVHNEYPADVLALGALNKTALICPSCRKPVGVIVDILNKNTLVMQCQACDNRWTVTSPGTKPH